MRVCVRVCVCVSAYVYANIHACANISNLQDVSPFLLECTVTVTYIGILRIRTFWRAPGIILTISAGAVLCHVSDNTTQPYRVAMFLTRLPGILCSRRLALMHEGPFCSNIVQISVQTSTHALEHMGVELRASYFEHGAQIIYQCIVCLRRSNHQRSTASHQCTSSLLFKLMRTCLLTLPP